MQSQMIGLQNSLDRILNVIQGGQGGPSSNPGSFASPPYDQSMPPPPQGRDMQNVYLPANGPPRTNVDIFNPQPAGSPRSSSGKSFPPLPGFAPPVRSFPSSGKYMYFFSHSLRISRTNTRHMASCPAQHLHQTMSRRTLFRVPP